MVAFVPNNETHNYTNNNVYFIFQARVGSTRLPKKMIMPFYNNKTIIELIIDRLINAGIRKSRIIIATTNNSLDKSFTEGLKRKGLQVFIGDEQNVLNRFINAAKEYKAHKLIRICSDNPFLNMRLIFKMLEFIKKNDFDYVSYRTDDNIPAILTHYGLFGEYVKLETLEKIASLTREPQYLEHVTKYIYTHLENFYCQFLPISSLLEENKWLRLTVDTIQDFKITQMLYNKIIDPDNISEIIQICEKLKLDENMLTQIKMNAK